MAKKTLNAKVVSSNMQKTVIVDVERKIQHPLYKKFIRKNKAYVADTNGLSLAVGDIVRIEETRPLSKTKHFKVTGKIKSL